MQTGTVGVSADHGGTRTTGATGVTFRASAGSL